MSSLRAEVWHRNIKKTESLARERKKPLLIDFYVPWCKYCLTLQKKIYPSRLVRLETKKYICLRVNGEKNKELLQKYHIHSFPTILILDNESLVLGRIDGFLKSGDLARKLKKFSKEFQKGKSLIANWKKKSRDILSNYQLASYYFNIEKYEKARIYFLQAWRGQGSSLSKKKEALYNVPIVSMHMDNYQQAISDWKLYMKYYPKKDDKYINARYYRGLCYFYSNDKDKARKDLKYASQRIKDKEARFSAQALLKNLR